MTTGQSYTHSEQPDPRNTAPLRHRADYQTVHAQTRSPATAAAACKGKGKAKDKGQKRQRDDQWQGWNSGWNSWNSRSSW